MTYVIYRRNIAYFLITLRQVSWGTKGSDKAEALPSVASKKTKDQAEAVIEDTERTREDLDATFTETVNRAVTKIETKESVEKPTMDDENKTFRTRLVAMWMFTNAGLAVAIENLNGLHAGENEKQQEKDLQTKQTTYFNVILYSTFGLAAVRFIGVRVYVYSQNLLLIAVQCLFYWFKRNLFRFCRRN
jgi:chitin synthase